MLICPHVLRLKTIVSDMGAANGAMYVAARIAKRIHPAVAIERFYIVAQPVKQTRLLPSGRGESIKVLMFSAHDPLLEQLSAPSSEITRRFAAQGRCFLAMRGERVVGHLWITHSGYREPAFRCEYSIRSPDKMVWDFDLWIERKERMGWVFSRLWDECNEYLRQREIGWTLSRISAFNPESLRAHQRFGIRRLRSLTYFCVGRTELLLAFPPACIRITRSTFPLVELDAPQDGRCRGPTGI